MTEPTPNTAEVTYSLPPQLFFLGQALARVANSARHAVAGEVRASGHEFEMLGDLSRHMGVVHRALTHLSPRIDGLMNDVIENEGAGAIEVGRSAGRLEQVLSEFVDGYLEARATHASTEASEARSLILGVYLHHIREICEWMEALVEVIANPASAIAKRGIAAAPTVTLPVVLKMTSPPEMERIDALSKSLRASN